MGQKQAKVERLVGLLREGSAEEKASAAIELGSIAAADIDADDTARITAAGGIALLVGLVAKGNDAQKEKAAGVLCGLAGHDENKVEIAAAGAIPPLVELVQNGNGRQKNNAAAALWGLSVNDENKVKIAAAGGIPPLVTLVQNGNDVQPENAAAALWSLSVNDENKVKIATAGGIPALVALVKDGNDVQREKAAGALWNLSVNSENKVKIATAGGIPPLVKLMRVGNDVQRENAAAALWGLSVNDENKVKIARAGGIRPLVGLIMYGNDVQKENAAGALRNLAVNNENNVKIATTGGIRPLVVLVTHGNDVQKENAAGALWNLSLNRENREMIVTSGGIPPLISLVQEGNDAQKEKATGVLWKLASENCGYHDLMVEGDVLVECLIGLVSGGSSTQRENAAGVLGILAHHLDADTKLRNAADGGIASLLVYVTNPKQSERIHEDLAALLGLCVGSGDTVRSIMANGDGYEILSKIVNSENEMNKNLAEQLLSWLVCSLSETSDLCKGMEEAEPICRHVLDRLHSLQERGVYSLETVLSRFNAWLKSNSGKPSLLRVVGAYELADTVAELHGELDLLEYRDGPVSWKPRWEIERADMVQRLFNCDIGVLVSSLDDTDAQTEALTLLANAIRLKKSSYTTDQRDFLYAVMTRLVGFSDSEVPNNQERCRGVTIADGGAIPVLVDFMQSGKVHQKANVACALTNFSSDDDKEDLIAPAGGISSLVVLVERGNVTQQGDALRILRNLSVNNLSKEQIAAEGSIPVLVALVENGDDEQKETATEILWNLAFQNGDCQRLIISEENTIEVLVKLCSHSHLRQRGLAAGVLGFAGQRLDADTKLRIAKDGGVAALLSFITNANHSQSKHEVLIAILGLTMGGGDTVRSIVDRAGANKILLEIVESDNEGDNELATQLLAWLHSLSATLRRCKWMDEAEPICRHVLDRLQSLLDRGFYGIGTVQSRLHTIMKAREGAPRILRVIGAHDLADALADLHRELDLLEPQSSKESWKPRWQTERAGMIQRLFHGDTGSLVSNLDNTSTQTEALALLVREINHKKDSYLPEERAFLQVVMNRLVGFSGLPVPTVEKWLITRHDVQIEDEPFNRGAFGQIYRALYLNADVAVKCAFTKSDKQRTDFLREVNIWYNVSGHPNIVQLYGACDVGDPCFMVCKYATGASLSDYLYKAGRSNAWGLLLGVTLGLQFLHKKRIVHGDLKGDNILVDGDTAMITDFGMSFCSDDAQPEFENVGAIRWRAPEFVLDGKASHEADVYSLGMVIVEAVTGGLPWGNAEDLSVKWHMKNGKFMKKPQVMPDAAWELVCAMCDFDPSRRMKLGEVEKQVKHFAELEAEAFYQRRAQAAS